MMKIYRDLEYSVKFVVHNIKDANLPLVTSVLQDLQVGLTEEPGGTSCTSYGGGGPLPGGGPGEVRPGEPPSWPLPWLCCTPVY